MTYLALEESVWSRTHEINLQLSNAFILLGKFYGLCDGSRNESSLRTCCFHERSLPTLGARSLILTVLDDRGFHLGLHHI